MKWTSKSSWVFIALVAQNTVVANNIILLYNNLDYAYNAIIIANYGEIVNTSWFIIIILNVLLALYFY